MLSAVAMSHTGCFLLGARSSHTGSPLHSRQWRVHNEFVCTWDGLEIDCIMVFIKKSIPVLVYNIWNYADLHVYTHTAGGVWTQELSAVHIHALQTQQQREMLEEYVRCLQTVLEHVLDLAAWNTLRHKPQKDLGTKPAFFVYTSHRIQKCWMSEPCPLLVITTEQRIA